MPRFLKTFSFSKFWGVKKAPCKKIHVFRENWQRNHFPKLTTLWLILYPMLQLSHSAMDRCWLTLTATPALLRPWQKGCRLLITFRGTNPTCCMLPKTDFNQVFWAQFLQKTRTTISSFLLLPVWLLCRCENFRPIDALSWCDLIRWGQCSLPYRFPPSSFQLWNI